MIVFEAGGELRALDAKCTHEGCTVQFVPGDSLLWCACHNGSSFDGRVLSGPPPRPLVKWVATREGNDVILTMEKACIEGERPEAPAPIGERLAPLARYALRCREAGRVRRAQGGAGRRALDGLVLPGRDSRSSSSRPARLRRPAARVLPAGRATSYESIRFLTAKVPFGWLMRSIHCWSAHLMIVSLVTHMFSTMMLKAYRPPAGADLGHRLRPLRARSRVRLLRIPAALERAVLLRHGGGHRFGEERCPRSATGCWR